MFLSRPYSASSEHSPAAGAWHFVQACRLIEKKGFRTSLRAFAEFARRSPDMAVAEIERLERALKNIEKYR